MDKSISDMGDSWTEAATGIKNTTKATDSNRKAVDKNRRSLVSWGKAIVVVNQGLSLMGKAISLLKLPAFAAAIGVAVQAVIQLAGAAVALAGALGPLVGLTATLANTYVALGQVMGVLKLAGFDQLTKAMQGDKEAFKQLTPEAKKFGATLKGLEGRFKGLKKAVQGELFPGLTKGLQAAMGNFGRFKAAMSGMAATVGDAAARIGKILGSKSFGKLFSKVANENEQIVGRLAKVLGHLTVAFFNVLVAARPLTDWLTKAAVAWSKNTEEAAKAGRKSGEMAKFFEHTRQILSKVWKITSNFTHALVNLGSIGRKTGMDLFGHMNRAAKSFRAFTESASGKNEIKQWFDDIKPGVVAIGRLLNTLTKAFIDIGDEPGLKKTADSLGTSLVPALTKVFKSLNRVFTPALIESISQIARLFARITKYTAPFIALGVKGIGALAKGLNALIRSSPVLKTIAGGLAAIIAVQKGVAAASFLARITGLRSAWMLLTTSLFRARIASAALIVQEKAMALASLASTKVVNGLKTAMFALGNTTVVLRARLMAMAVLGKVTAALQAVKLAVLGLSLTVRGAMMATGIGALIVGATLIITHWDKVKRFLEPVWNWIKQAGEDVWATIGPTMTKVGDWFAEAGKKVAAVAVQIGQALAAAWRVAGPILLKIGELIVKSFIWRLKAAWAVIKFTFSFIVNAAKDVVNALITTWNFLKPAIIPVVKFVFNAVKTYIVTAVKAVIAYVKFGVKALGAAWKVLKAILVPVVKAVWAIIKGLFKVGMAYVKTTIKVGVATVKAAWWVIKNVLINPIKTAFNFIKGLLEGLWKGPIGKAIRFIVDKIGSAFSAVADPIKDAFEKVKSVISDAVGVIKDIVLWVIDEVINRIPGVQIDVSGLSGESPPGASGATAKPGKKSSAGGLNAPGYARGGHINGPAVMVGEEAPRHPEVVIATNPKYRNRNLGLWMQAGAALGVPGFAKGGLGSVKGTITGTAVTHESLGSKVIGTAGDVVSAPANALRKGKELIENLINGVQERVGALPPWMSGIGSYLTDAGVRYIKDKIPGLAQGGVFGGGLAGAGGRRATQKTTVFGMAGETEGRTRTMNEAIANNFVNGQRQAEKRSDEMRKHVVDKIAKMEKAAHAKTKKMAKNTKDDAKRMEDSTKASTGAAEDSWESLGGGIDKFRKKAGRDLDKHKKDVKKETGSISGILSTLAGVAWGKYGAEVVKGTGKADKGAKNHHDKTKSFLGDLIKEGKKTLGGWGDYAAGTVRHMRDVTKGSKDERTGVINNHGAMIDGVNSGLSILATATNKALKAFGVKPVSFGVSKEKPEKKQQGGVLRANKGAIVPGTGSGDKVPLHIGGSLAAMVEPGELVSVNNRTSTAKLMAHNSQNKRGAQHLANGGVVGKGEGMQPQNLMAPFDVDGAQPGFVPFMNFLNSMFGPIYVMSGFRAGSITTTGNVSNHASGHAVDISTEESGVNAATGPGGSGPGFDRMDALHSYMAQNISLPGDFLWRTFTGGNHYNHIHRGITSVEADDPRAMVDYLLGLPSNGSFTGRGSSNLPNLSLNGPPGALDSLGDASLAMVREAGMDYLASQSSNLPGGSIPAGGGGPADVKNLPASLAKYNKTFPSAVFPSAEWTNLYQMPADHIAALAEWAGRGRVPGWTMEQVQEGEGNFRPGSRSTDAGYGLWAITKPYMPASSPYSYEDMNNPVLNALVMEMMYPTGWSGGSPWYGDSHVTDYNKHYEGPLLGKMHGGIVQMLANGGALDIGDIRHSVNQYAQTGLRDLKPRKKQKKQKKILSGLLDQITGLEQDDGSYTGGIGGIQPGLSKKLGDLENNLLMYDENAQRAADVTSLLTLPGGDPMIDPETGYPMQAKIDNKTQVEWLEKKLEALWAMRNALIRANKQIEKRKKAIEKLIKQSTRAYNNAMKKVAKIKKQLEFEGKDPGDKYKGKLNPLDAAVGKWNAQKDEQRAKLAKTFFALGGKLPGDRLFTKDFSLATPDTDPKMFPNSKLEQSRADTLKKDVLPALARQLGLTNGALPDTWRTLADIQGGYADKENIFKGPITPDEIMKNYGGQLLETVVEIKGLDPTNDYPVSDSTSEMLDMYKQLAYEQTQRNTVLSAQMPVFNDFFGLPSRATNLPFGGVYHTGLEKGPIPGPKGSDVAIVAQAGEVVAQPDQMLEVGAGANGGSGAVAVIIEDGAVDSEHIRTVFGEEAAKAISNSRRRIGR